MASNTSGTILIEIKIPRSCPRLHYLADPDVNGKGWISTDSQLPTVEGSSETTFELRLGSATTKLFFYFDAPDGLFVHKHYYSELQTPFIFS